MNRLSDKRKVAAVIALSSAFFLAELTAAYITGSLALMADAIHYLTDLLSFVVTLVSICMAEKTEFRQDFSYGWQRARILGAFFNGAFLLALGFGIMLNAIERFTALHNVDHVKIVFLMGCVGLGLNVLAALFLHDHHGHHTHHQGHENDDDDVHDHRQHHHGISENPEAGIRIDTLQSRPADAHANGSAIASTTAAGDGHPTLNLDMAELHANHRHTTAAAGIAAVARGRDLGMLGALLHVLGDALNNVGVIGAALAMWFGAPHDHRFFYADPAVSVVIAIMVMGSAWPLLRRSGKILLQSAPRGVKLEDIRHDLERIPGVLNIHELHVWRLDQQKTIASAHLVVSDPEISSFLALARIAARCFHAYGIHSVTLQPELAALIASPPPTSSSAASGARGSSLTGASPHASPHADADAITAPSMVEEPSNNGNNGASGEEEDSITSFGGGTQRKAVTPAPISTSGPDRGRGHDRDPVHHSQGQAEHHNGPILRATTECQVMCPGQECEALTCCGGPRDSRMRRGD
ncbi:hypothetical protein VTJ83DRAFT_4968 [Remersonia thermophila]|uniref:Cation efflux protein n=1 Tax=Remersonia thermophila TaxID=72144 RepID=A0ABR4DBI3_9PEZI